MAQATIAVKNITASDIFIDDLGITIAASGSPNSSVILSQLYTTIEIIQSNDLKIEVISGNLCIFTDEVYIQELSIDDAILHLKVETEYEDSVQDASIAGINFDDILLTGGCGGTDPHIIATKAGNLVLLSGCS